MPFASDYHRDIHFARHGHKFGAASAAEYERMADEFMYGNLDIDAQECTRPNRIDRIRFGFVTHYQGVVYMIRDVVRTFYPVSMITVARRSGEASYFAYECSRIKL